MRLDENSGIPLYYQLKEDLKKRINNNYKIGEAFPTEVAISEEYAVSRATVRQALQDLVNEGLIYRKQGKGTFISQRKIAPALEELSFSKQMKAQNLSPSSQVLIAEESLVSDKIRSMLQIDRDMVVFKIVRLRLANNEPIMLETSFLPKSFYPEILQENLNEIPLFSFIREKHQVHKIDTFLHSSLPTEQEAEALRIDSLTPVTSIEQLVRSIDNSLALIYRIVRGDRCKYQITFDYSKSNKGGPFNVIVHFNYPENPGKMDKSTM